MKKAILLLILTSISMVCVARDDVSSYSVKHAMIKPKISNAIGTNVKFFFGHQSHPKVEKSIMTIISDQKTNAFMRSDKNACQWAFASAMKTLHNKAIAAGGNAVINIRSNYKGSIVSSKTTFQCGSGALIAGVSLIGEVVKIK
ncbi:MAG: excinuclease ABC subunit A [Psychromonas sp.]|nr:excinuclease ABC subunit A [Psychromonas sp.]